MACRGEAELRPGERIYLALDLSNVHDLTALVAVSAEDRSRLMAVFWKPESSLHEHSKRDFGAGNMRYVQWRDEGWLETAAGRTVDRAAVAAKVIWFYKTFDVVGLAYDRWRIDELLRELERADFECHKDGEQHGVGLRLVPWGQGFKDMAPAIDALETAVIERALVHPGNPVLTWNMANAVAVTDPAGNRKIDKSKARFRIDGAVAAAMAIGLKARDAANPGPTFEEELASIAW